MDTCDYVTPGLFCYILLTTHGDNDSQGQVQRVNSPDLSLWV